MIYLITYLALRSISYFCVETILFTGTAKACELKCEFSVRFCIGICSQRTKVERRE